MLKCKNGDTLSQFGIGMPMQLKRAQGSAILLSTVAVPVKIPTNSVGSFPFPP